MKGKLLDTACLACGHLNIQKGGETKCGWCERTPKQQAEAFKRQGLEVRQYPTGGKCR